MKNIAVFGIYPTRQDVYAAIDELKAAGFSNQSVSVLFPDHSESQNLAHEKSTKAPEGAATGATSGIVVGGALGWLAGVGAIAIPGVGPLIAAGPILAMLAGSGIGGTVAGIAGGLIGMGIPEYEAKRYEGFVKDGGILISVHTDTSAKRDKAKEVLKQTGARDISSTREETQAPPLRKAV